VFSDLPKTCFDFPGRSHCSEEWAEQLNTIKTNQSSLHLINSRDPLWLEQQAQSLLPGTRIDLWPNWDPQRHADVDLVLTAGSVKTVPNTNASIWHFDDDRNVWEGQ